MPLEEVQLVDVRSFALFVGAALFLLLTPGAVLMFVVPRSVRSGRVTSLASSAR